MPSRHRRKSPLARGVQSPAARTLAASAALAAGTVATAKIASSRGQTGAERRYRLETEETPKEGISRVARGELGLTISLLAPNRDGGAEAVHEARKALKRLRALLRLSRPALDERRYRHENVIFRDAGRELSEARDAQVLLETLDGLLDRFGDELPRGSWSRLRGALEVRAAQAQAQANGAGGYDDVLAVLTRARRRVSSWSLPAENGSGSLTEGFDRIYRRGRRKFRRAQADPTPENLHELRKRAKDLWHAAQLLEPMCPKQMKPLAKSAHRLSNLLGDDHDLVVLRDYADSHAELLDEGEQKQLHKAIDRRRKSLRRKALGRARDVYRRKPKRMLRRLSLV